MNERNASRSAAVVAAHRAMEWHRPEQEQVCRDPYAERLIPEKTTVIGESDMPAQQALAIFRQFIPGFHEYFLARTRYIDDLLETALAGGVEQVAILGAGYDSRAHRIRGLQGKRPVFEVDHPATQAVKRERLSRIPGINPDHARYIPADFETSDLDACLLDAGLEPEKPTFFIWEGVTMYLTPETAAGTLGIIFSRCGPGSILVFDITTPEVIQGTDPRPEAKAWCVKARENNEPLRFGISRKNITGMLENLGFTGICFADHNFFKENYFSTPGDEREVTPILTIVTAQKIKKRLSPI